MTDNAIDNTGHQPNRSQTLGATILHPLILALLLGAFIGSSLYTFWEGEGLSYLGDESVTCANCHVMREHYGAWQHASHHAVATCNDCHVPDNFFGKYLTKALNGYSHSKAFTLQNFHEPFAAHPRSKRIVQQNCIRCHEDMVSEMCDKPGTPHDETFSCVKCHPAAGHDI